MAQSSKRSHARRHLIAESEAMQKVVDQVEQLGPTDEPVIIVGEPGSGRELVARIVHASSPRKNKDIVIVNAAAAPKKLFSAAPDCTSSSMLRQADNGTMLVKHFYELARSSQRRLSRLMRPPEERRKRSKKTNADVDVRFIGMCDMDLGLADAAGVLNAELYARVRENQIVVPPLRDRVADIPALTAQLVRLYAREFGKNKGRSRMTLSTRACDRLAQYPWPGNVAELKSIARRLVLRAKSTRITAGDVDAILPVVAERVPLEDMAFEDVVRSKLTALLRRVEGYDLTDLYTDVVARVERPMLEVVMSHTGNNQVRAAELLGLNRNTLRRKLDEHDLLPKAKRAKPARRTKRSSKARKSRKRNQAG